MRQPYFTWVYGCQLADVAVDTRTGKITVNNVVATHDVGKVINPVGFSGQVYGGVLQGMIGYGMLEDFNTEHGVGEIGKLRYLSAADHRGYAAHRYHCGGKLRSSGANGAKVIGEPVLELGAAALNNAGEFRHRAA